MDNYEIGIYVGLFILWLYNSCVIVDEGWYKNIKYIWGRHSRTFSSVKGKTLDRNHYVITGNSRKPYKFNLFGFKVEFYWIFWGIEFVDGYWFSWTQGMSTERVLKMLGKLGRDAKSVIWGDLQSDTEVAMQRYEWTSGHKDQDRYLFRLNKIETGEEPHKPAKHDSAEDVKLDILVGATVNMYNLYDVQYTDGGKVGWYGNLETTLEAKVGLVIRNMTYPNIKNIMGETIEKILVDNPEPTEERPATSTDPGYKFIFVNSNGKRKRKITFLESINYIMMYRDRTGVRVSRITIRAVEVSEESKAYVASLQEKAISIQNLATATNNANALGKFLDKKTQYGIKLIDADANARIRVKKEEDVTATAVAKAQPGLRVLVKNETDGVRSGFDVTKVIETMLAFDINKEANAPDKAKPDPDPDNQKKQNQKKGGSK